jgi:hypothetical protein
MANRYIHPNDEFEVNINLKVKVTSVGDWSGIPQEVTKHNYETIKNDGTLVKEICEKLKSELSSCNEVNLDFLDRVIFEVVYE